jgi:hypothetical protein
MLSSLRLRWRAPAIPSIPAEAASLELFARFPLYAVNGIGSVPRAEFVSVNKSPPISLGAHMIWPDTNILDPFGGNVTGTIEYTSLYQPKSA